MDRDVETQLKGAIGENIVIGEFLKRGFDVYLPVVDRGIDCILRSADGIYSEIQIKMRATTKRGKYVFEVRDFEARDNFFIVCYQAALYPDFFWIIPSKVFKQHGYERPKYGAWRLVLNLKKQRLLERYKKNFEQLGGKSEKQ